MNELLIKLLNTSNNDIYRHCSDVSGSKNFDWGWVGVIILLLGLGQVSHLWVQKFSPQNTKFFNFFPSDQKNLLRLGQ